MGQWFLRFICGARKPIEREKKRIYPVVDRVQQAIKINLGIEVVDKVNLMIVDASVPNAAAVGKNTLIIERSLYETCNDEELVGVIAHEMGHLHNGDSVRLGVALGVSTITLAISSMAVFLFSVVSIVSNLFSRGKEETSIFAVVFGFVFMLFLWIFLLCIKGGNWIIDLALLFQGRKQEYKADKFAVKAGFGDGLLSFLEKIKDFYMDGRRTIADKLYATHPPVMLRIGKLEEYLKTDE